MMRLRSWKKNLRNMIDNPWDTDGDSDHPNCPHCGTVMNFYGHDENGDFPFGEGYWECSDCSFNISESDI